MHTQVAGVCVGSALSRGDFGQSESQGPMNARTLAGGRDLCSPLIVLSLSLSVTTIALVPTSPALLLCYCVNVTRRDTSPYTYTTHTQPAPKSMAGSMTFMPFSLSIVAVVVVWKFPCHHQSIIWNQATHPTISRLTMNYHYIGSRQSSDDTCCSMTPTWNGHTHCVTTEPCIFDSLRALSRRQTRCFVGTFGHCQTAFVIPNTSEKCFILPFLVFAARIRFSAKVFSLFFYIFSRRKYAILFSFCLPPLRTLETTGNFRTRLSLWDNEKRFSFCCALITDLDLTFEA